MKLAHNVAIRVFLKPGEEEACAKTLESLVPLDLGKEKILVRKSTAEGMAGGKIMILGLVLEKDRHIRAFIESLLEHLSAEDKRELATQENRVDEECDFYLRLDKKGLLSGEWKLTGSGDCYHVRMSIAAYPKKRENALELVKKVFS